MRTSSIHQADLAVYRAKLQGRNRVLDASDEPMLGRAGAAADASRGRPGSAPRQRCRSAGRPRRRARPSAARRGRTRLVGPRFFWMPRRLAILVGAVGTRRPRRSASSGRSRVTARTSSGLIALVALVGIGQALSIEVERTGTISVTAVGALAGAAIIGPRGALVLAVTIAAVDWTARRSVFHQLLFNVGALTLATFAAAEVFSVHFDGRFETPLAIVTGVVAGFVYFALNTGLLSLAIALEGREGVWRVWRERFSWLLVHYLVYGFVAGVIYEAYRPIGVWALFVFALPLAPDAQDAGDVPAARGALDAEAARGGRDDPAAERHRSSR